MKKGYTALILLIGIILTSGVATSVSPILRISGVKCDDKGVISFDATNDKEIVLLTNNINVSYRIGNKDYIVSGKWSKPSIYKPRYSTMEERETAFFNSTLGAVNLSGTIKFKVEYPMCYQHPDCSVEFEQECPGFKYSCDLLDLSMTRCYNKGDYVYFNFSDINAHQFEKLSPYDVLSFDFYGSERVIRDVKLIEEDNEIKKKEGIYMVEYGLRDYGEMSGVIMKMLRCGYVSNKKICKILEEEKVPLVKEEKEIPPEEKTKEEETKIIQKTEEEIPITGLIPKEPIEKKIKIEVIQTNLIYFAIIGVLVIVIIVLFIKVKRK